MHWTILLLLFNQKDHEGQKGLKLTSNNSNLIFELRWNLFKATHSKQYETHEEQLYRKSIFQKTLQKINLHNERFRQGFETFDMGLNQFSDLTEAEFEDIYSTKELSELNFKAENNFQEDPLNEPKIYDTNWYTPAIPVKDQGKCGSCFTFATTGLLEYDFYYKKGGKVISLSEQELLDCVHKDNYGCNGGRSYYALQFIKQHGINFESDYPYKQHKGTCEIRKKEIQHPFKTIKMTQKSEKSILKSLSYSPIIVSVYLNTRIWKDYKSGYINAKNCEAKKINHAILLLGTVNENGHKVWFARNSFGSHWGMNGHVKLEMNTNTCQIGESNGFYVIIDK